MNTVTRMIVVLTVTTLVSTGFICAQEALDESSREALAAQREALVAQTQNLAAQREAAVDRMPAPVAQAAPQVPAIPPTPRSAPPPAIAVNGPWSSFRSGGTSPVLVIPSAEIQPEDVAAIAEDMNIMSRIFVKNLEEDRIAPARSGFLALSRDPLVTLLGGGSSIESMYLQGYGALFLMKADFPLSPPPQVEEEKQTEQKTETDAVWEQMRRDIYEPQEAARDSHKEPEEKYDAEKVENLKTTLIKSLKHAANIRSLKSDESVILTVTGSGRSSGTHLAAIQGRGGGLVQQSEVVVTEKGSDGATKARIVKTPPSGQTSSFSPTVLVIRAKKADIDQFAKGTLDVEQFRQRTQVLACPLGQEAGRTDALNYYLHTGRY